MTQLIETDWRARATITVEQAAPILGIGRSSAYDAAASGQLPTLRIGRRILVPVPALRRMLGELPNDQEPAGGELLVKTPDAGGRRFAT